MATTPNYGWVMPDPTDFVTDLPADFEIFGDAVDATVDGIETTANAAEATANAAQPNVITTEGDLVVGDASGDPVRVAVGTVGQVLASDGDTVEWVTPVAPPSDPPYLSTTKGGEYLFTILADKTGGASQTVQLARTYYLPVYLPNCTLDRIEIRTGNAYTGNHTVRLGIYNNTNGRPGTVLLDAGTVSATANNTNYSITINQVITEGWYWLASNCQTQVSAGTKEFLSAGTGVKGAQFFAGIECLTCTPYTSYFESSITGAFATAVPTLSSGIAFMSYVRLA
jgi:hypothetical protein